MPLTASEWKSWTDELSEMARSITSDRGALKEGGDRDRLQACVLAWIGRMRRNLDEWDRVTK